MKGYHAGLVIAFFIAVAMAASAAEARERGLLLAPWGDPGIRFTPDEQRGPWARRWVGGKGTIRMMLTVYRSPDDARRVALLSRGLGEGPQDDDDRAFLRGFLPRGWRAGFGPIESAAYSRLARGLCATFRTRDGAARLCMASRPDSAVVATVMTGVRCDTAQSAALLLARHAARHPVRMAGVTVDRSSTILAGHASRE